MGHGLTKLLHQGAQPLSRQRRTIAPAAAPPLRAKREYPDHSIADRHLIKLE
jgi:hypothetical protein